MSWAVWLFQGAAQDNKLPSLSTGAGDYLRVMLVLGAVLALAYAALRFLGPRMTGAARVSTGSLKIVARLTVEPRKNLYVLQAGSEFLLIGTSESQMHYLTSLDSSVAELVPPAAGERAGAGPGFSRLLRGARRSKGD